MAKERNTTFIVSSHQLHDMEKFCTDILILDKGKSILQGKTEEILSETTNIVDCILEEAKAAESVLFECQGISLVSRKGNQFTIRLENICFDEFIKKLVENHLHIRYLSMRKHSLQDIFLKLTGGAEPCIHKRDYMRGKYADKSWFTFFLPAFLQLLSFMPFLWGHRKWRKC